MLKVGSRFMLDNVEYKVIEVMLTLKGYYYKVKRVGGPCCGSKSVWLFPAKLEEHLFRTYSGYRRL